MPKLTPYDVAKGRNELVHDYDKTNADLHRKKVRNLDKKLTLNTCLLKISTSNHSQKTFNSTAKEMKRQQLNHWAPFTVATSLIHLCINQPTTRRFKPRDSGSVVK
jgi:hypothetical protein